MPLANSTKPSRDPRTPPIVLESDTPPSAASAPVDWAFHYEGPIESSDDRSCELCNSVAQKHCVKPAGRHGNADGAAACPSCEAYKKGWCPLHCGLARALAEHAAHHPIDPSLSDSFKVATDTVNAYVAASKGNLERAIVQIVSIKSAAGSDAPFAKISIEISVQN